MSGELRTSQFRWTTTANDDFVIGSPEDAGTHNTKFLVFQTSTTPGYASNPHFRCEWTGAAWAFKLSPDGSSIVSLSDIAYKSVNNTFSGDNIFNTVTINSTLDVSGISSLTGLTVANQLVTLNKGGAGTSGASVGIQVEEASAITGYFQTNATRSGWVLKAPASAHTITFLPDAAASVNVTMPASNGVLVIQADLASYDTHAYNAANYATITSLANYATLATTQTFTAVKTLDATLGGINFGAAGVNGSITGAGVANFHTLGVNSLFSVDTAGAAAGKSFTASLAGTNTGSLVVIGQNGSVAANGGTMTYAVDTAASQANSYFMATSTAASSGYKLTLEKTTVTGTNGIQIIRTISNKTSLEVLSSETNGSSLILKDRTTGTRYEIYMNSGTLTVGLA